MYDGDGNLLYFPVDGEPVQSSIRAKSSKGKPPKLLEIGNNQPNDKESFDIPQKADDQPKQLNSPKELLFACVQQLVFGAAKRGEENDVAKDRKKTQEINGLLYRYCSKRVVAYLAPKI